jgi:hypothetical protein
MSGRIFMWGEPLGIALHPQFGIMLFASRTGSSGPYTEMTSMERFVIEELPQ